MSNGLVEKFNGTLRAMLKKLCSEQPRQWSRYINALLFAYREVPQESTGFAPFGAAVRSDGERTYDDPETAVDEGRVRLGSQNQLSVCRGPA